MFFFFFGFRFFTLHHILTDFAFDGHLAKVEGLGPLGKRNGPDPDPKTEC